MNRELIKDIGFGLLFVLTHLLLFQYLALFGAIADPLLIYLLWLCMKYNRFQMLLFAAGLGLFQDMLFDVWGAYMFSKTLMIFIFYKFVARHSESRLMIWQIFLSVWVIALIHNGIFLSFASFIDAYTSNFAPFIFLMLSSLYTALVGALLFVFKGNN